AYTERIQKPTDVNEEQERASPVDGDGRISEEQIGWVYSAFLLVYAACMTPGGWVSDRFGTRLSLGLMGIGLGLFAALTGCAGWLFSRALPLLIAFFVIRSAMGAFAAPMYPAGSKAIARWIPWPQRAGANGFVQGSAALGIAMTPLLFGYMMDKLDWPGAFLVTGLATLTVGMAWLWYARDWPADHPGVNLEELKLVRCGDATTKASGEAQPSPPAPAK